MRRKLTMLAAAAAFTGGLAAGVSTGPALAEPTGCDATTYDSHVEALCDGGDGRYRAVALCWYFRRSGTGTHDFAFPRNEYGPVVDVGQTSRADCDSYGVGVAGGGSVRFV